eukprot:16444170-Heterocapsa_arctica.AAC.1
MQPGRQPCSHAAMQPGRQSGSQPASQPAWEVFGRSDESSLREKRAHPHHLHLGGPNVLI